MQSDPARAPPELQGVDLSNWRTPPFNRRAFHHIGDLIPSAPIPCAAGSSSRFLQGADALNDFGLTVADGTRLDLDGFLRRTATDGWIVVANGKIVDERYDNGTTEHTPHILMSATKSVVGLLVGILQARGELDIDALVSSLVPEVGSTAYAGATLRDLIDMRTGVVFDSGQQDAYNAATGWEPSLLQGRPVGLHVFFEQATAPAGSHGGPFRYVSANTDLLGWAIERATGQTFASLVSALLWKPMGATSDAYITLDPEGAPRCTGGLCATTRDFAAVGQLLIDAGHKNDGAVIPMAWVDDVMCNGDRESWRQGEFAAAFRGLDMSYRNGWYVIHNEPETLFAMGIHGQHLFVDRANDLVIAKVSSQTLPIDPGSIALTLAAVSEIRRCLQQA
jgi:CubicO group peptidase (beta-lactamase class C family)